MKTRVLKLSRVRGRQDAGYRTLFFTADGRARRQRYLFFAPDAVPEFEGEEAWFLAEKPPKRDWQIVRRVNADGTPCSESAPSDA